MDISPGNALLLERCLKRAPTPSMQVSAKHIRPPRLGALLRGADAAGVGQWLRGDGVDRGRGASAGGGRPSPVSPSLCRPLLIVAVLKIRRFVTCTEPGSQGDI